MDGRAFEDHIFNRIIPSLRIVNVILSCYLCCYFHGSSYFHSIIPNAQQMMPLLKAATFWSSFVCIIEFSVRLNQSFHPLLRFPPTSTYQQHQHINNINISSTSTYQQQQHINNINISTTTTYQQHQLSPSWDFTNASLSKCAFLP